jgi:hypothetical protein
MDADQNFRFRSRLVPVSGSAKKGDAHTEQDGYRYTEFIKLSYAPIPLVGILVKLSPSRIGEDQIRQSPARLWLHLVAGCITGNLFETIQKYETWSKGSCREIQRRRAWLAMKSISSTRIESPFGNLALSKLPQLHILVELP